MSEHEQRILSFEGFLEELMSEKKAIIEGSKTQAYSLINKLTKWIVLKEVEDKEYIERLLEKLILEINTKSNLLIKVNQADFEAIPDVIKKVETRLGSLSNIRVEVGNELSGRGLVLESEVGVIDGSLKAQMKSLDKIFETKDVAILVGGSGLYINAVLFGIDPFPEIPRETRLKALHFYKENGLQALRDEVRNLDPKFFLEVDLDNPRRLMRALEVCYATGEPYSNFTNKKPKHRDFESIKIAYKWERELLYSRINERVDLMLEDGLIAEVQKLTPYKKRAYLKIGSLFFNKKISIYHTSFW